MRSSDFKTDSTQTGLDEIPGFPEANLRLELSALARANNSLAEALNKMTDTGPQTEDRKRVLVVDDSPFILDITRKELEKAGYEVMTVDHVFIARTVNQFRPHLILMDVNIRSEQGNIVTRALREHTAGRDALIILYSVLPEDQLGPLAESCGADGFICKSNNITRIASRVERLFSLQAESPDIRNMLMS